MGKSSQEKVQYAQQLLVKRVPYRRIQTLLTERFGGGMSNTTLKKLQSELGEIIQLRQQVAFLNKELKFYKRLYVELLSATKRKLNTLEKKSCSMCNTINAYESSFCGHCGNSL